MNRMQVLCLSVCLFSGFFTFRAESAPDTVTNLFVRTTDGVAAVSWTAPGGPATVTNVDLRYSLSPIDASNWTNATKVRWLTDPGIPGTVQVALVSGLLYSTGYYFAIRNQDSAGLWSPISAASYLVTEGPIYSPTLLWDGSTDPEVVGYRIYIGRSSGTYDRSFQVGNVNSSPITGLVWNVRYYVSATAIDNLGQESDPAQEISFVFP